MPPLEQDSATLMNGRNWVRRSDLARLFPAVFGEKVWKPLKIGIYQDILEILGREIHTGSVRLVLRHHTAQPDYLRALAAGGPRFGLDGSPDGEVSVKAQTAAAMALESSKQRSLDVQQRSLLLKAFEATGLSLQAYAIREGISHAKLQSDVHRALHERQARHEKRALLAKQFEASGMSADEYAAKRGIPLGKLQTAIAKVAAQSSTHCAASPNA